MSINCLLRAQRIDTRSRGPTDVLLSTRRNVDTFVRSKLLETGGILYSITIPQVEYHSWSIFSLISNMYLIHLYAKIHVEV